jgi:DNA-binding cell septation regulator SpoVG
MDQRRVRDMQRTTEALLDVKSQNIAILSISPVKDRGSLRAFLNVRLGPFVINDCTVIQEPGKRAWFSLPVLSYKNKYGTIQYKTLIQIVDEELKNEISQAVLSAWENTKGEFNGELAK